MVKVAISQTGDGKCALSGFEGNGLFVAFDNDQPLFLTWRSFKQLLALRLAQCGKPPTAPPAKPMTPSPVAEVK